MANKAAKAVRFRATLYRPSGHGSAGWTFLRLPAEASAQLPSRGQVSVDGSFNGVAFTATLEPDGEGGHWLKVDRKMRIAANAEAGDTIEVEVRPASVEPEPEVPPDLRTAVGADAKAAAAWSGVTPAARRDWVHWINSAKRPETRARRVANACDMLAKGKKRPCCFDRSGMYSKSLSCPVPEPLD